MKSACVDLRCSARLRVLLHLVFIALFGLTVAGASAQTIAQRLNDIVNRLSTIQSNVSSAVAQARNAALQTNGLPLVITRIQEAYDAVDGPGRELMESYIVMLGALIEQQREGFEAFITPDGSGRTPAAAFRAQLTDLLSNLSGLTQELIEFDNTLQFELRLDAINRLVAILPDGLLYPFHVIMSRSLNLFESGLVTQIVNARAALPVAREVLFGELPNQSSKARGDTREVRAADLTPEQQERYAKASGVLKGVGNTIATIGKILSALAESDEKEVKIGIHGYVGMHVKVQPLKVVAGLMDAGGEVLVKIGERMENRLDDQEAAERHQALLAELEAISGKLDTDGTEHEELLANQATLLTAQEGISDQQITLQQQQQVIIARQNQVLAMLSSIDPRLFPEFTKTPPAATMMLDSASQRVHVDAGGPVSLSAGPVASEYATYQWRKDGIAIPGAVFSSYVIHSVTAADAGDYDVVVTDEQGSRTSASAVVDLIPSRVLNVSVRLTVPDARPMIAGFVLDSPKQVVVRGIGQSLAALDIPLETTMEDPAITIYNRYGQAIATNDNYQSAPETNAAMTRVGAFPLSSSRDAVILTTLPAGIYTVHLRSKKPTGGDCILEIYDAE